MAAEPERIVVGVDGSDAARAALVWALQEAWQRQAIVEAVYVWKLSFLRILGVHLPPLPDPLAAFEAAKKVLQREIRQATATTDHAVPVKEVLIEGAPDHVLVDASTDAALLVVGTRGIGELRRVGLGSVSHHCAQHAHCPVVIVRVPNEDALVPHDRELGRSQALGLPGRGKA